MSMMDTMNSPQAAPQPQADPSAQGQQPQPTAPQGQMFARLSEGGDLQGQFDKVMALTSAQLWQKGMSDLINEQLLQDDSDPSAVLGKFVSFLLNMTNGAFNAKQQAPEPIVMCGVAEQMSDQMTDIALNNQTVSPGDADDTSEAAALIGLSLFLENNKAQIQADDMGEYQQIIQQLVQQSPDAAKVAQQNEDDARQSAQQDTQGAQGVDQAQAQQPQPAPPQGGMGDAMGVQ